MNAVPLEPSYCIDRSKCVSRCSDEESNLVPMLLYAESSDPLWWRILSVIFDYLHCVVIIYDRLYKRDQVLPGPLRFREVDYRFRLKGLKGVVHDRRVTHPMVMHMNIPTWFAPLLTPEYWVLGVAKFYACIKFADSEIDWGQIWALAQVGFAEWICSKPIREGLLKPLMAVSLSLLMIQGIKYYGSVRFVCLPSRLYRYLAPSTTQGVVTSQTKQLYKKNRFKALNDFDSEMCLEIAKLIVGYVPVKQPDLDQVFIIGVEMGKQLQSPFRLQKICSRCEQSEEVRLRSHPILKGDARQRALYQFRSIYRDLVSAD